VTTDQLPTADGQRTTDNGPKLRQRVRIRFTKQDDLRWISHRDLMRVWERLFRRAGVNLSMTEGFHPKPRINFPSALAVGVAGLDELIEIDLAEVHTAESLRTAVEPQLPPGMVLGPIEVLPAPDRKAQVKFVTFEIEIPAEQQPALANRIAWLLAQSTVCVEREGRKAPLDLRPLIDSLALEGNTFRMRLRVDREGSARPREVLAALEVANLEYEGFFLTRTKVEVE
jgi:radical SAM-linked protein